MPVYLRIFIYGQACGQTPEHTGVREEDWILRVLFVTCTLRYNGYHGWRLSIFSEDMKESIGINTYPGT